ncbi:zinc finger protein ZFPM1-like [Amblyomma americanum]
MDREDVVSLLTVSVPSLAELAAQQCTSSDSMDSDASPATRRHVSEQRRRLRMIRPMGEATVHRCRECQLQFRDPSRLVAHHVYKHQSPGTIERGKKMSCPICKQRCKSQRTMAAHLGTHLGERLCTKCGAELASGGGAAMHQLFHRTAGNFMCEQCGMAFVRRSGLNAHNRVRHAQHQPMTPR